MWAFFPWWETTAALMLCCILILSLSFLLDHSCSWHASSSSFRQPQKWWEARRTVGLKSQVCFSILWKWQDELSWCKQHCFSKDNDNSNDASWHLYVTDWYQSLLFYIWNFHVMTFCKHFSYQTSHISTPMILPLSKGLGIGQGFTMLKGNWFSKQLTGKPWANHSQYQGREFMWNL